MENEPTAQEKKAKAKATITQAIAAMVVAEDNLMWLDENEGEAEFVKSAMVPYWEAMKALTKLNFLLTEKDTPVWIDHCDHGVETFVGTMMKKDHPYDIYLYYDNGDEPQVCQRYGNEGREYSSNMSMKYWDMANLTEHQQEVLGFLIAKKKVKVETLTVLKLKYLV